MSGAHSAFQESVSDVRYCPNDAYGRELERDCHVIRTSPKVLVASKKIVRVFPSHEGICDIC